MAEFKIEVDFGDDEITEQDLREIESLLGDEASDEDGGVGALRVTYCVTCDPSGRRHTVRAKNAVFAFFKAVGKCGKGFQMTKGPCR